MACAATAIWSAASWLASGSMSDEFSGQMTNNGCGARPARTSSASRIVSRTWLSSTARRWALKSSPSSRHVALHGRDVDRRVVGGASAGMPDLRPDRGRGDQHQADAEHRAAPLRAAPSRRFCVAAAPPPIDDLEGHRGQAESEQCHRERHQRRAAELRERQQRAVGLAETDHTPRESAERHRRLRPLRQRPEAGEPDRPAGQPAHRDGQQTEQRRGTRPAGSRAPATGSSPTSPPVHGSSGM